jgi:ribosomal protein L40E
MKTCSYCGRDNIDEALHCRECGTKFEPPEPPEDRSQLEDPALSLVIVKTFNTVVDAAMLKTRLEEAGIEACIPEEFTPQMFWTVIPSPLGSVTVRVAAKDYDAANAILADYTSTALTAPRPDELQSDETIRPQSPAASDVTRDVPTKVCVSCCAVIPTSATFCPECQWTQPDVS